METIRNYLETMFAGLPNTAEVLKAKDELWQMMEDKYAELIAEGKAENEAVGIVISEFGNLDELAQTLGISLVINKGQESTDRAVTMDDAKAYLKDKASAGFMVGLGVFLCITCAAGCMLAAGLPLRGRQENMAMAAGVAFLFICIAAAVGLFIYSSVKMNEWAFLKQERCSLDYATAEFVKLQRDNFRSSHALLMTIGMILLIVSVIPVSVFGILLINSEGMVMMIAVMVMLCFIGIGVMMIIIASEKKAGYNMLLSLNRADTVAGGYAYENGKGKAVHFDNKTLATLMSVYQPTVTCLYLIWSFMTFDWYITWIIFPVAAIIKKVIIENCGKENDNR